MDMLSDKQSGDLSKKLLLIYQQLGYKSQIELLDTMNSVAARMDVVSVDLKISYMYLLITYASFLSVVDKISLVPDVLDDEKTKAFAVGLKLFGETLLENKDIPLFKEFMPHFSQFMKALKQTVKTQNAQQAALEQGENHE